MKLIRLAGSHCQDDNCPAVFEDGNGSVLVQGALVSDGEALRQSRPGADEALVALPRELILEAARRLR